MGAYFCPESPSQTHFVREKYSSTNNPTATGSSYQQVSTPRSLPPPIEEKKHTLDDFVIKGLIGEGGFASVYLVQQKNNSKKGSKIEYAMKKLGKKKLKQRKVLENLKIERMVYASMKNNFIIGLNYAFQDKSFCYFVMEYAEGGDVYSLINNPKQPAKTKMYRQLGQEAAKFILACVILGLECAHSHNIIYRDLKPQNVLLFKNGYLKLTDFGLAKQAKPDEISLTIAGTKIYYAPQILQKKGHNKAVDFWTLGVFLHELILLCPPFDSHSIVPGKFTNVCLRSERNRDWKSHNVSSQAKNLINSFLKVKPQQRLGMNGFQQIKNHAFFRYFNWQLLNQMRMQSPLVEIATTFPVNLKSVSSSKQKQTGKDYDFKIEGLTFEPDILKEHNDLIL